MNYISAKQTNVLRNDLCDASTLGGFQNRVGGGNEEENHILGFFGIGFRWKHLDKQTPEHVLPMFKGIRSLPRGLWGDKPGILWIISPQNPRVRG